MQVDASLRQECDTPLGIRRLVFGEVLKLIILVFIVSDVAITAEVSKAGTGDERSNLPLASKVEALRAVIPERHTDTRNAIKDLEAPDGFLGIASVPQTQLTVAHTGKPSSGDAIVFAHPHCTTVLRTWVARNLLSGFLLPDIPYSEFLVSACGDQERSISTPGQGLDNVVVLEVQFRRTALDIPYLHGIVARSAGKDVLGGGVEEDVAYLSVRWSVSHAMACEQGKRTNRM